ncbi:MAG TPA: hypothetical protein ENK89_06430 [Desulfobulbaceae bacterium]|nr:hypothetical protein [Desulfobulbaceae bacterium]
MLEQKKTAKLSRGQWQAHIRAQKKSGLSRAEYCRRHELSYHALTYWQRKCTEPSRTQSLLVPVPTGWIVGRCMVTQQQPAGVKILLNDRIGIEITERFSSKALLQVLSVLENR